MTMQVSSSESVHWSTCGVQHLHGARCDVYPGWGVIRFSTHLNMFFTPCCHIPLQPSLHHVSPFNQCIYTILHPLSLKSFKEGLRNSLSIKHPEAKTAIACAGSSGTRRKHSSGNMQHDMVVIRCDLRVFNERLRSILLKRYSMWGPVRYWAVARMAHPRVQINQEGTNTRKPTVQYESKRHIERRCVSYPWKNTTTKHIF